MQTSVGISLVREPSPGAQQGEKFRGYPKEKERKKEQQAVSVRQKQRACLAQRTLAKQYALDNDRH